MSKKRKDDDITRLEKENRELKSLNRSLMKRLKKVDRLWKEEFEKEPEVEEDHFLPPAPKKCPECSNNIIVIEVAGRKLEKCSWCNWRSKAVRSKKE